MNQGRQTLKRRPFWCQATSFPLTAYVCRRRIEQPNKSSDAASRQHFPVLTDDFYSIALCSLLILESWNAVSSALVGRFFFQELNNGSSQQTRCQWPHGVVSKKVLISQESLSISQFRPDTKGDVHAYRASGLFKTNTDRIVWRYASVVAAASAWKSKVKPTALKRQCEMSVDRWAAVRGPMTMQRPPLLDSTGFLGNIYMTCWL